MDLTPEEARHIRRRRTSQTRDDYFREGLAAAAAEVKLWDGIASAGDLAHLAAAILKLKRQRRVA
jgi:hypothetical protein